MAAPTLSWLWPNGGPLTGTQAAAYYVGFSPLQGITIGGRPATILYDSGPTAGWVRIMVPASPVAGIVDVVVSNADGSTTHVGGYTYSESTTRLYFGHRDVTTAAGWQNWAFPAPTAKRCLATISTGGTFNIGDPSTRFTHLTTVVPPGASGGGWIGAQGQQACPNTPAGQFYGVGGYSMVLRGVRAIAAQQWRMASGGYFWGETGANFDKISLYVWRPSTDAVVGVIYDNTGDLVHPAGTLAGGNAEAIYFAFDGAAVNGIQDDDVLCVEWLGCGSATKRIWMYGPFRNGTAIPPPVNHQQFGYPAGVASYIESTENLFAPVVPPLSVTSITPDHGSTSGGTAFTVSVSGGSGTITAVAFGGVAVTSITDHGDGTASCVVPAHAAGTVDVVVTRGTSNATLAGGFTYVEPLAATKTEILGYATASGSTLSSLRRGAYGTGRGLHRAGAAVVDLHSAFTFSVPYSRLGQPMQIRLRSFNSHGRNKQDESVPVYSFTPETVLPPLPDTLTLQVVDAAGLAALDAAWTPEEKAVQYRELLDEGQGAISAGASPVIAEPLYAVVAWTMDPPYPAEGPGGYGEIPVVRTLSGFDLAFYTGTDADEQGNYVRSVVRVGENIRSAVVRIPVTAPATMMAAAQALYFDWRRKGPWRNSAGAVDLDPETWEIPSGADVTQARNDAAEALLLAGSKTRVFYENIAPTSGMSVGDLWYNTDKTTACPDANCKGHPADANGNPLVGSYAHRSLYVGHRYTVSGWRWASTEQLIIASEIAAGAITADKIAAHTITANELSSSLVITDLLEAGEITADKITLDGTTLDAHWIAGSRNAIGELVYGYSPATGLAWAGTPRGFANPSIVNGNLRLMVEFNPSSLMFDATYSVFVQPYQVVNSGPAFADWRVYSRTQYALTLEAYTSGGYILDLTGFNWRIAIMAMRRS